MLILRRRDGGGDFSRRSTFFSFAGFATGDTQQFAEYVAGKVWHIGDNELFAANPVRRPEMAHPSRG
jgi:hypothetical protein